MSPGFILTENLASVWKTTCTSPKAEPSCSPRKVRLWRIRSERLRDLSRTNYKITDYKITNPIPPSTCACAALMKPALPPPSIPNRPDILANRCARQPATGPESSLLFAECAGATVRGDRLRERHRCDRAAC